MSTAIVARTLDRIMLLYLFLFSCTRDYFSFCTRVCPRRARHTIYILYRIAARVYIPKP